MKKTMCHSGSDGSFHSGAAESQQNLVVKVGITVRSGPVYGWFENVYTEPTTSKCHNCLLTCWIFHLNVLDAHLAAIWSHTWPYAEQGYFPQDFGKSLRHSPRSPSWWPSRNPHLRKNTRIKKDTPSGITIPTNNPLLSSVYFGHRWLFLPFKRRGRGFHMLENMSCLITPCVWTLHKKCQWKPGRMEGRAGFLPSLIVDPDPNKNQLPPLK